MGVELPYFELRSQILSGSFAEFENLLLAQPVGQRLAWPLDVEVDLGLDVLVVHRGVLIKTNRPSPGGAVPGVCSGCARLRPPCANLGRGSLEWADGPLYLLNCRLFCIRYVCPQGGPVHGNLDACEDIAVDRGSAPWTEESL
jgi:hypothetical protein